MNNLIILNYQREIPPFMISQIEVAAGIFDRIYYVTRQLVNNNSETILCHGNVEVVEIKPATRNAELILSPIKALGQKWFLTNYKASSSVKGKLKKLLTIAFCSNCLYDTAKSIIANCLSNNDKVATLATWFSTEAVTIARLKRRFPETQSISYAHSFEIDPDKGPYVPCNYNRFKLENIDETYFISSKMREIYFNTIKGLNLRDPFLSKTKIHYLGCFKKFDTFSTTSQDGVFRICSCSGITPVKRLHLIAQALEQWDLGPIEWAHLGGGPLENEIKEIADNICRNNKHVNIIFAGQKTNTEVQKYLSSHPIDLFINVSDAEGLPVSIMESCAYGIPALATDVGGTCEIINNETGILIYRDSTPKEIAKAIGRYYLLPDSAKSKYREAAHKMWAKRFNAEINASRFYNHIKSLC